jgi:hypothetical protein
MDGFVFARLLTRGRRPRRGPARAPADGGPPRGRRRAAGAPARLALATVTVLGLALALLATPAAPVAATEPNERWTDLDGYKLSEVTLIGAHNPYERSKYQFLPDALQHSQVIEIDIWPQPAEHQFIVSHGGPAANHTAVNDNNCYHMDHGGRDQDIKSCIENLWQWHQRYPDHPLVIVKLEPKSEFYFKADPAELDKQISNKDGIQRIPRANIFKPVDLLTKPDGRTRYATLDEAARANNWPTMARLRGKFMFYIVPGPSAGLGDTGWRQYSERMLSTDPNVRDNVLAFPAMFHHDGPADPRGAKWRNDVVVFDGQFDKIRDSNVDTTWHFANHYLFAMTLNDPARVAELSHSYKASIINTDWPWANVFAMARGQQSYRPNNGPIRESSAGLRLFHDATNGGRGCLARDWSAAAGRSFVYIDETCDDQTEQAQAKTGAREEGAAHSVVFRANGQVAIDGICLARQETTYYLLEVDCVKDPESPEPKYNRAWTYDATARTLRSNLAKAGGADCLGATGGLVGGKRALNLIACTDAAAKWTKETFGDADGPDGSVQIYERDTPNGGGWCWTARDAADALHLEACQNPTTAEARNSQLFRHDRATGELVAVRGGVRYCLELTDEDPPVQYRIPNAGAVGWMNGDPVRLRACDGQKPSQRWAYAASSGRFLGVYGACLGLYTPNHPVTPDRQVFGFASCHDLTDWYRQGWATKNNTGPTVSVTGPTTGTGSGTVTFVAEVGDPTGSGITSVRLLVDGQDVNVFDNYAPYQLSLNTWNVASGPRTITVVATDSAGDKGSATTTLLIDREAPTVTLSSPITDGNLWKATTLTATAVDNAGGVGLNGGVSFVVGNMVVYTDNDAPFEWTIDPEDHNVGVPMTITARACDKLQQCAGSPAVFLTARRDNGAPTVTLTGPAGGATVSNTIELTASAGDFPYVSGMDYVQFYLDGQPYGGADANGPYSVKVDTRTLTNGPHTFFAKAVDRAGNVGQSQSRSFIVSNS